MKPERPEHPRPGHGAAAQGLRPVICYPVGGLVAPDLAAYRAARAGWVKTRSVLVPPREARCFDVAAGEFFRITSVEGPQVGDLNLWNAGDSFRALLFRQDPGAAWHASVDRRPDVVSLPHLRPMATITEDTLDWYGFDGFGGSVHDVIGTRCDPYTNTLLSGGQYHHCCHSNLSRALAERLGLPVHEAEALVHDVLNVFMCTGFTRDTGQYFMKASPVRPGDFIEFLAEIDLVGALSACPGGDCSAEHSSDEAACFPLLVEVFRPVAPPVGWSPPPPNGYDRSHGV